MIINKSCGLDFSVKLKFFKIKSTKVLLEMYDTMYIRQKYINNTVMRNIDFSSRKNCFRIILLTERKRVISDTYCYISLLWPDYSWLDIENWFNYTHEYTCNRNEVAVYAKDVLGTSFIRMTFFLHYTIKILTRVLLAYLAPDAITLFCTYNMKPGYSSNKMQDEN